MKPLALAVAFLVIAARPAAAQTDPASGTATDTTAEEATKAAAKAAAPAADESFPDPAKEYAAALQREKDTGKDQVWDGMKMGDAPEGFKNPMTPEAIAQGWRAVVVNGETVGACNGSMCTSSGLQPDLFGPAPPAAGTTADNLNTAGNGLAANAANPPAGAVPREGDPGFIGPVRPPTDQPQENPTEVAATDVSEGNEAGLTETLTNMANNPADNTPQGGAPDGNSADNPNTALAFNDSGNAFTPGNTGGGNPQTPDGSNGRSGENSGMIGKGGGVQGQAVNCAKAGNCDAVAKNLIEYHKGLAGSQPNGPRTEGTDSIASAAANFRAKSPTLREAEALERDGQNGVAAAIGALSEGETMADDASYKTGRRFDNSGSERSHVPTKLCDRHTMGQVGICPE